VRNLVARDLTLPALLHRTSSFTGHIISKTITDKFGKLHGVAYLVLFDAQ